MKKNNLYIENLLGKPVFEFQKFHQKTKLKYLESNLVDPKSWPDEWKTTYYKAYSRFEEIELPRPKLKSTVSLKNALYGRESSREFSKKPMSKHDLSTLFHYSAGIRLYNPEFSSRFYPSAGGRYPLELYVLSLNTELPQSIYHYYVKNNSLERMSEFKKDNLKSITAINWVENAGCVIFICAVFNRNTNKYGNRGYRHVMTEVGLMTQNFYILSSALNLSICAIGGYMDDNINKLLDLDKINESVVGVLVLGRKFDSSK